MGIGSLGGNKFPEHKFEAPTIYRKYLKGEQRVIHNPPALKPQSRKNKRPALNEHDDCKGDN